jgi:DNA-binding response OmpR family regulator
MLYKMHIEAIAVLGRKTANFRSPFTSERRNSSIVNKGKLILLVEDNEKIMAGNIWMLKQHGYDTDAALTLAEARALINERKPDVIVLDIMLPDGNGLDFMCELRENENLDIPTLLLTGLTAKEDVVRGLKAGGDDYLTKPYDFPVLLARVEALLRRAARVPQTITKGRLTLDVTAGAAALDGIDLSLTKIDFALLLQFIQSEERFFTAEYLHKKIWKTQMEGNNQALKSAISRLNKKIDGSGWCIAWSRGEGYIFERE